MTFKSAAIAAIALSLPALAHAAPLTWSLSNAVFADGGTASGSFVWDADTQALGAYEFTMSGGDTDTFGPATYSNANEGEPAFYQSFTHNSDLIRLYIFNIPEVGPNGYTRSLYISVVADLTNAGGTIALDRTSDYAAGECYGCNPYRAFSSGALTAQGVTGGVPEPATWALMMMGFGALGATLRQRRHLAA